MFTRFMASSIPGEFDVTRKSNIGPCDARHTTHKAILSTLSMEQQISPMAPSCRSTLKYDYERHQSLRSLLRFQPSGSGSGNAIAAYVKRLRRH